MEGEEEKKGPIDLDWDKLLPSQDDDPPPLLVVATATAAAKQTQSVMGGEQLPQREEFQDMPDDQLNHWIRRQRHNLESMGPRLPDKGEKLRANIKRIEDEIERRKLRRVDKDDDGCEKLTQSQNQRLIGASDGFRQCTPSSLSPSQSSFALCFGRKLEDNTDSRTVNAFEKELPSLNRCERRKPKLKRQLPTRGRNKSGLSSRQTPFQCPSSCSGDVDKHFPSNGDQKGRRNASQVHHSNGMRPRYGKTVVLVDEEEPQLIEMIHQADDLDECMKGTKIYYPSRDDPESIEICYSDMDCLAPQAYLSSTIMNFYIRYLQQVTSPTDRARCDYHFFNTYFYKKLNEAVLNKCDKEIFAKFRRWWKGVNIFEKSYILLPIHENLHWSLVIICIPDKEDESGPIVLHLDSLGLHFSKSIFGNIRSFLTEEWDYLNQREASQDLPIADKIWKNLPRRIDEKTIAVPQQRNEYDCGLFVLYFMERFIEEAPERLKKTDLMFGKRWFKPEEASGLRRKIRNLLIKEFKKAIEDKCVVDAVPLQSAVASEIDP